MKLIHWSPKENKESILENGIKISDTWTSCSILTPFHSLNRWWIDFLLNEKEQVGFVFELTEFDYPLVHSHWCIDTYEKQDDELNVIEKRRHSLSEILKDNPHRVFKNSNELKKDYEETIIWRIGDTIEHPKYLDKNGIYQSEDKKIIESGIKLIKSNPKKAKEDFFDNPKFIEFVFEDYEILLFKEITPERIIKVISENEEYKYSELIDEIKTGANIG
jgi:hypothetical protein